MLGTHCIKSWSSTQAHIALSSAEAEYYAMVKGASNALGVAGMLKDMGVPVGVALIEISLYSDASAALGIAQRRGLGKVRHVELQELWLQHHIAKGTIKVFKVKGEHNISDSLTKHSTAERIEQTMYHADQIIAEGRHDIMPKVAQ